MRKKIVSILLSVTIILSLSACGNKEVEPTPTNEPTSEVVEEVEPTSTSAPIEEVESTPTIEVEETVVESMEEPEVVEPETSETPEFAYSHTWSFPDNMEGFTRKYLNDVLTEWSLNETHYVANDGTEMNFTWEGPAALGEMADAGESTLFLYGGDDYELKAWGCEVSGPEDALREFDKETIVSWDSSSSTYTEGDYYEFIDGDIEARVTFKISRTINDIEYTGYACYFENYETMTCYQTTYVERNDIFDDERALNVVNSIDFWDDYTPLE